MGPRAGDEKIINKYGPNWMTWFLYYGHIIIRTDDKDSHIYSYL